MDNVEICSQVQYVLGEYVYLKIPANRIRGLFDGFFPNLAVDKNADIVSGFGHRWSAGHDLFVDVSKTLIDQGPDKALHQAGHILLTDFPTKAGIPIPGFSKTGLGKFLVDCGLPKGMLSISLIDNTLAILAVADGYSNLAAAIAGELHMTVGTFFSTYAVGTMEICISLPIITTPPGILFGLAGVENILAGVVATVKDVLHIVSFETFLGQSLTAAVFGIGIAYWLKRKEIPEERLKAIAVTGAKSALVTGLSIMSGYFAIGYMMGCLAFELGKKMAAEKYPVVYPETAKMFAKEAEIVFGDGKSFNDKMTEFFDNYVDELGKNDGSICVFNDKDLPKL